MSDKIFFIAEAGVNHNGSLELAMQLVDVAAQAGADAVKFQTFKSEKLVTANAAKASYQRENTRQAGNQLSMLQKLELSISDHQALVSHCKARGIRFMSTAFDAESLDFLSTLDMPAFKIPSGDITCGPLLLQAARLRQPLIISSGMSTLADIEAALGVVAFGLIHEHAPQGRTDFETAYGSTEGRLALKKHVTLLHCVTQYPAPAESVHLRAMDTMAAAFGLPVGYSDHTLGIAVSLAAAARGAVVLEKHFTLDRTLPGPDHAASLEPKELVQLIDGVRTIGQALGTPIKSPAASELENRPVARRSLVAARRIEKGEFFDDGALTFKRPGQGVSPLDYWDWLGRPASRAFDIDELIQP